MLKRIPKVLLLVALLATFVASSAPILGASRTCRCYFLKDYRLIPAPGGCSFDQRTAQCVSVSCRGGCF
jgi:hypothetical protein